MQFMSSQLKKAEIQFYFILVNTLFFVDVKYDNIDVRWWGLQENKFISMFRISESIWKLYSFKLKR